MYQLLSRLTFSLLLLTSVNSWALSAGELTLHSGLGEPLRAEFSLSHLNGLSSEQIKIRMASREIHRHYKIADSSFQQRLMFGLSKEGDNFTVAITTEDPIKEPYQHFVLKIVWPEGELHKEFKLLIDPIP